MSTKYAHFHKLPEASLDALKQAALKWVQLISHCWDFWLARLDCAIVMIAVACSIKIEAR